LYILANVDDERPLPLYSFWNWFQGFETWLCFGAELEDATSGLGESAAAAANTSSEPLLVSDEAMLPRCSKPELVFDEVASPRCCKPDREDKDVDSPRCCKPDRDDIDVDSPRCCKPDRVIGDGEPSRYCEPDCVVNLTDVEL
jgi:hypothetical protein